MLFLSSLLCEEPFSRPKDCGGMKDAYRNLGGGLPGTGVNREHISEDIDSRAEILNIG